MLGAANSEARVVLDGVLADRIRFTPDVAQRRYTLTMPIAFERVTVAVLPALGTGLQETVASPMPASWNQIASWLKQIDLLREAA
jgi:hypothetical protein